MTDFAKLLHADGPNPEHTAALQAHGPCPEHRFSYVNVRAAHHVEILVPEDVELPA